MRAKAPRPHGGQPAVSHATGPVAGKYHRTRNVICAGIERRRREIAPLVFQSGGRKIAVPAHTQIKHELTIDAPIILSEASEVIELLPDEADRVNRRVVGIAQKKGCEGITSRVWVGPPRNARL